MVTLPFPPPADAAAGPPADVTPDYSDEGEEERPTDVLSALCRRVHHKVGASLRL